MRFSVADFRKGAGGEVGGHDLIDPGFAGWADLEGVAGVFGADCSLDHGAIAVGLGEPHFEGFGGRAVGGEGSCAGDVDVLRCYDETARVGGTCESGSVSFLLARCRLDVSDGVGVYRDLITRVALAKSHHGLSG